MTRYKVEYEIEGTLRTGDGCSRPYIQVVGGKYIHSFPHDATVTEIKPPFEPGWYKCPKTGALFWVDLCDQYGKRDPQGTDRWATRLYLKGDGTTAIGAAFRVGDAWLSTHNRVEM